MAEWHTLDEELPKLFHDLMGIPVEWSDQPRKFQRGALGTLDIFGFSGLGVDDVLVEDRPAAPATPTAIRATVIGQREWTLQVSVWTRNQKLSRSARRHLDSLRTKLRLPTTLDKLRALGIALVRIEGLVDDDPIEDGRVVSRSMLDIRFASSVEEVDEEIPFIESVRIRSGTVGPPAGGGLEDPEGNPLADQIDITITEP